VVECKAIGSCLLLYQINAEEKNLGEEEQMKREKKKDWVTQSKQKGILVESHNREENRRDRRRVTPQTKSI